MTRQLRPNERDQLADTLGYLADLLRACGVVRLSISQSSISYNVAGSVDAHALNVVCDDIEALWIALEGRKQREHAHGRL